MIFFSILRLISYHFHFHHISIVGKKVEVFDFLTYWREIWFSFSYKKVSALDRANGPSNEIDRVSKFDNSLLFGAKQKSLVFLSYDFLNIFFTKNSN